MKNKTVISALVAGILGGAVSSGGILMLNRSDNNIINTKVIRKTVHVDGQKQSETAFNKVRKAVVSVINYQKTASEDPDEAFLESMIGGDFGGTNPSVNNKLQIASEGSGVVYKKSGGSAYIVTNNHVVEGENALKIIKSDGSKISAKIVGKDPVTDLAVLKVDANKVDNVASFGDSNAVKVGETALAIGSPLGSKYATSLTKGIISAKNRTLEASNKQGINQTVIQTDTAINPGNSGGALINLDGQVIGINSSKVANTEDGETSVEGMGFAIPVNEVKEIANQLVNKGSVTRPALGLGLVSLDQVVSQHREQTLKLPSSVKKGIVVMQIFKNSPADKAGIKKYDVITKINNKHVDNLEKLRETLYKFKLNDHIKVGLYDHGVYKYKKVTLSEDTKQLSK